MMKSFLGEPADEAAEHWRVVEITAAVEMPVAAAGLIIAALGQAVRVVSLNYTVFACGPHAEEWDAIGALDDAHQALTAMGMLLFQVGDDSRIILEPEVVVWAARAIRRVVEKLEGGIWEPKANVPGAPKLVATLKKDLSLLGDVPLD